METTGAEQGPSLAWQRRRGSGRVRVYFCCCPLGLLLAPPLLLARLARAALARVEAAGAHDDLSAGRVGRRDACLRHFP